MNTKQVALLLTTKIVNWLGLPMFLGRKTKEAIKESKKKNSQLQSAY